MTLTVLNELEQGSDAWHDARRGMVTASVAGQLLTTTGLVAANDTSRTLAILLAAERITGHTDPTYTSPDMERGNYYEPVARDLYTEHHAPALEVGFMVRDDWGYSIGYSPDGLVGDDGLIEIKSRRQKKQLATILSDAVPGENMAQCQAGLLVSGRAWIDYVSYCGGMPLWTKRVLPDPRWHDSILEAVELFEVAVRKITTTYELRTAGLPMTERLPEYDDEMRL